MAIQKTNPATTPKTTLPATTAETTVDTKPESPEEKQTRERAGLILDVMHTQRDSLFKASEDNRIRARQDYAFARSNDGIRSAKNQLDRMSGYIPASSMQSNPAIAGTFKAGSVGAMRV